jgi:hypothetical protein
MRRPSILDVVHAVKLAAESHPEVMAWWYAPPKRLRLQGERPERASGHSLVEVVIEAGDTSAEAGATDATDAIASEVAGHLARFGRARVGDLRVTVRAHRGPDEDLRLFRLRTRADAAARSDGQRAAATEAGPAEQHRVGGADR